MAGGKSKGALHETGGDHEELQVGSDRSFGIVFTVFFALMALWLKLRGGPSWTPDFLRAQPWWSSAWIGSAGLSAVFLILAFTVPRVLHPLNVLWMRFGALLNKIVSPIIMGILFFLTITPMGLFMRARGKDLLRLKWDKNAKSYWIERTPPGPPPESMKNQF